MTTNDVLSRKAEELQIFLASRLKCYCVVGWMKDDEVGPVFTVYVDRNANIDKTSIPQKWYGLYVHAQEVQPPGSRQRSRSAGRIGI